MTRTSTRTATAPTAAALIGAALLGAAMLLGAACASERAGEDDGSTTTESVPGAVRATWSTFAGVRTGPADIERETEHGLETWSAEFAGEDGTVEVTALADGTLVAVERDVVPADLPSVVAGAAATALDAPPERASHLRLAVYEIEERDAKGVVRERFVDPFGEVLMTRSLDAAAEHEVAESIDDLPPAARRAIEREVDGARLEGVEHEQDAGRSVHAASWTAADGSREVKVLDDGTVLSVELPTGALPARVRALAADVERDDEDEPETGESAAEAATVERMLLVAWEIEVPSGDSMRTALVLPTGETIGDVNSEPREPRDRD